MTCFSYPENAPQIHKNIHGAKRVLLLVCCHLLRKLAWQLSTNHAVKTLIHWTFNCVTNLDFLSISSHSQTAEALQCQCIAEQSFWNEKNENHMKVQETRLQSAHLLTFVDMVQYVQSHCCSIS